MTRCVNCDEPLSSDSLFCSRCGSAVLTTVPEEVFHYGLCPKCGEYSLRVVDTARPYRVIKCSTCDYRFQTIEVIFSGPRSLRQAAMLAESKSD